MSSAHARIPYAHGCTPFTGEDHALDNATASCVYPMECPLFLRGTSCTLALAAAVEHNPEPGLGVRDGKIVTFRCIRPTLSLVRIKETYREC